MADYNAKQAGENWSKEAERKITKEWEKNPIKFINKGKIYSIDTPPPYVNTPIHMGHAVTYCYMDFFARYKRMEGFNVLFPLGLDRNGLPIEMAAQKKFNVRPEEAGREKFIEYCRKVLEEASNISMDSFSRLGISFSNYKFGDKLGDAYMTDSPEYRKLTQATFYDMWEKNLIYEDKKIVNYCPGCRTSLADAEIVYEEKNTFLYYLKFKIKNTREEIIIATTRPELLGACEAILFNPNDKRYEKLEGKKALTPLYNKEVKIMAHASASMDFGSGLVMMCSFGDLTDIRFFKEQKLKPVILIDENGKMNEKSGFLRGLSIREARKFMLGRLHAEKLIAREEQILHRGPICERSKDPVEFIEMKEFYLKQLDFKDKIMKMQKKIKFYDETSRKILENWIESIDQDWPLSRRRYYATPIPLWKCRKCGKFLLGRKGEYTEPWKIKKKCSCGGETEPETRVFDTWFDSSISELYILGYGRNKSFEKIFPCTLRPQGKEIIRTWLYYTLLRAYLLFGRQAFQDVWINYHILDAERKKMAKSKGNIIDPQDILNKYGAEPLRLWSALEGDLTKQDLACSEQKIQAETKTINKLWNLSKFILQFKQAKKPAKLEKIDELFIDYAEWLTDFCDKHYETYDFHAPCLKLRNFLWEIFASHYLEVVKNRAYNQERKFSKQEQESAVFALYYLLKRLVILLYPIIPAISFFIYERLNMNILKEKFPKAEAGKKEFKEIENIMEFNSQVWKMKKEKGIGLRDEIKGIKIPAELKNFEKDLKNCHNLK